MENTQRPWLVQYRASDGQTITTEHPDRGSAVGTMVDSLIGSAVRLWQLGGVDCSHHPARAGLMARGDSLMEHAVRLMATEEGSYLLQLSQGRRWIVCEA